MPACLPRGAERPVVLVTANNLNVVGHNAAAVGIARDPDGAGFVLRARDSDCSEGESGFYYLRVAPGRPMEANLVIDTGEVPGDTFYRDCDPGDTKSWDVYFDYPFLTPPVVFVTTNDNNVTSHNVAAVGMARNVTPYEFTLVGRNSDCAGGSDRPLGSSSVSGQAGFYWVAIGCSRGCG
jgi:hypothetical protein